MHPQWICIQDQNNNYVVDQDRMDKSENLQKKLDTRTKKKHDKYLYDKW